MPRRVGRHKLNKHLFLGEVVLNVDVNFCEHIDIIVVL